MRYERLKHLKAKIEKHIEAKGLDIEEMQLLLEVYNHIVTEFNELDRELNRRTD